MLYQLENLTKKRSREDNYRLCIRNLVVHPGEHVAITGPSGSGKSTALDILGLTLKPDAMENFRFRVDAQCHDIVECWRASAQDVMSSLRRRYIGYVLQTGELLPFFSVLENIRLSAALANLDRKEALEYVDFLMETLNISSLGKAMPATLSVGERQRAAICRALAAKPRVILADEPTAALDPILARTVMHLFLDIIHNTGAALILVSHDLDLVREFEFRELQVQISRTEDGVLALLDDSSAGGAR